MEEKDTSVLTNDLEASAAKVFKTLQKMDMSSKHKEKNNLSYLPWASAWIAMMQAYPTFEESVVKDPNGNLYHTDGKTCWVETSVTVQGITRNQILPVMDYKNKSIPVDAVTSMDVNKSLQRCLTKNFAKFGLDINLWIGEEVSDEVKAMQEEEKEKQEKELKKVLGEIAKLGTDMIANGYTADELYKVVSENNNGNKNPNSIKDIDTANKVLTTLQAANKKLNKKEEKK